MRKQHVPIPGRSGTVCSHTRLVALLRSPLVAILAAALGNGKPLTELGSG